MFNKLFYRVGCAGLGLFMSFASLADNTQMNETLVQIIAQLNATLPLIDTAEHQQDPDTAVQFHFETWVDAKGVKHAGLRQDILAIRQGIIEQINQPAMEPRTIKPLKHDFIGP